MKFRGMITEHLAMKEFMNIITTLSKLSKMYVMRINTDNIYFIVPDDDQGPSKPLAWCELSQSYYFKEYCMEGVSSEYNEIFLELSSTLLLKSLITLRNAAKWLKLKLTNKQTPCFTVEIELTSDSVNQQCVHDIPVKVIPRRQWSEYEEPIQQNYHITIDLPNLKLIKNIIDRMKNICQYLIISANEDGRLTLGIETDMVSMSAHFPDLNVESLSEKESESSENQIESENTVSARVDIRKFFTFLTSQQITYDKISCNIVNGLLVKLHLVHFNAVKLQCFLTEISK